MTFNKDIFYIGAVTLAIVFVILVAGKVIS